MGLCGLEAQVLPFQRELMRLILLVETRTVPPNDFTMMIFMAQSTSEHLHVYFFPTFLFKAAQGYIIQDAYSLKKISFVQHKY